MNYRLAQNVELVERDGGIYLLSKTPLCVLRLNRSLADLVGRGAGGASISASAAEVPVMEQLASKGFVERLRSTPQQPTSFPDISIVIPVKDRAGELQRCLTSLSLLNYPQEKLQVIVVDDGSSDDSPLVARQFGALLVPSGGTGRGPAAARNVGAAMATGEILAFIDSDCSASPEWLGELLPAFTNPAMAAVGGQVDGMCSASAIDRYESIMSSLSLGSRERSGSGGDDTFYLPSCNLLVRRSVFRSAGGFKDEMHVGEDVDLTWRMRDQGWTICYLPAGNVLHEHRSSIRSFMSRRFDYGTSEGMLQILHPGRRKQMVIPTLLAIILTLCILAPFTGWWSLLLAGALLAADATAVRKRIGTQGLSIGLGAILAGRLRALGSLVYYLCYHLIRYYAVPLIIAALIVPKLWAFFIFVLACSAGVDHAVKKPPLSFLAFAGIYFLEQIAYGSGVFWGCLSRKCFASYRVHILRHAELSA
ncbi:MAG: mycofactocin biosynthesis glycosyltransferase MftF [Geobacteraceae bacterium]|nr:mycofactocin biosynthesis glycosyltransferase MftF [Geobacteraceae bacterium]